MKTFIIVLSLNYSDTSYSNLLSYIKTATYWARPFKNTWLVRTYRSSGEIRDGIMSRIHSDDKALVIALEKNDWAAYRLDKEIVDWMKGNL